MNSFLPFSKPSVSEQEIAAIGEVLRSGWITTGAKTAEFEEQFRRYCGAGGAVALSSATAGMHLVLKALDVGPGDEVITPSLTWVSTVNLIMLSGATPIFADVDRHTLMTGVEQIEPLLSEKTKLIIPVHFAGAAVDMQPLRRLAARHDIPLVEDAAHAVGTEYLGKKIGKLGTTIFSFHPIKNMTTGEGGMFCSDDQELLARIRQLKFHGLGGDAHDRLQQGRAPQAEVVEPGYKYNMTDIASVLGMGQLERLEQFIVERTELARRYLELLTEVDEILPLEIPGWDMRHAWNLFIIRLDTPPSTMDRDWFMDELKKHGIGTGIHFKAVHLQKYYRQTMPLFRGALPATEWNSQRLCSIPLFPGMRIEDVDYVVAKIKEVLAQ